MSDKPLAARILLIDDDPSIQRAFRRALQDRGHGVVVASSTNEAVAALNRSPFDLCLLDLCLGGESGIELLPRIRELAPWLRVVVVTASSDVQTAISAIRAGAADFLSKPCSPDELMHTVGQQIEAIRMQHRIDQLERDREAANGHEYTSLSPAYRATLEVAHRVAQTDATLLILGENGTGKTQLARAIHRWSQRSQAMFATVSCPSLSAELLASELFGHAAGAKRRAGRS